MFPGWFQNEFPIANTLLEAKSFDDTREFHPDDRSTERRVPALWRVHKLHHSMSKLAHSLVEEGFSATKLSSLLDGKKAFFLPQLAQAAETKQSFFTPSKSEASRDR